MKTRNLLLALGCAVAFTACTNDNEPVVAPAMRTVTLSVEVAEPADTRVAYTVNEDVYKFAWTSTDKLLVFYYDETQEESTGSAEFSMGEISANGKQATFTGSLPTEVDQVLIVYSSRSIGGGLGFFEVGFPGKTVTDDASVASALAENTFLYAFADVESSGELPNVKLQHGLAYLLLEKGLKMIKNDTSYSVAHFDVSTGCSCIFFELEMIYSDELFDGFEMEVDGNGCLTSDYLIPFQPEPSAFNLYFFFDDSDMAYGFAFQPSYTYQPGVIYKVAKDNASWVPIEVDLYDFGGDFDDDDD